MSGSSRGNCRPLQSAEVRSSSSAKSAGDWCEIGGIKFPNRMETTLLLGIVHEVFCCWKKRLQRPNTFSEA